jgi:hypothetical protein
MSNNHALEQLVPNLQPVQLGQLLLLLLLLEVHFGQLLHSGEAVQLGQLLLLLLLEVHFGQLLHSGEAVQVDLLMQDVLVQLIVEHLEFQYNDQLSDSLVSL